MAEIDRDPPRGRWMLQIDELIFRVNNWIGNNWASKCLVVFVFLVAIANPPGWIQLLSSESASSEAQIVAMTDLASGLSELASHVTFELVHVHSELMDDVPQQTSDRLTKLSREIPKTIKQLLNITHSIGTVGFSHEHRLTLAAVAKATEQLGKFLATGIRYIRDHLAARGDTGQVRRLLSELAVDVVRAKKRLLYQTSSLRLYRAEVKFLDSIPEIEPVAGMTVVDNKLYVIAHNSNEIQVYDVTENVTLLDPITVPDLLDASDMTSCSWNQALYIADSVGRAVHVVDLLDINKPLFSSWRVWCRPTGLSINAELNVVVACGAEGRFKIFDRRGYLLFTSRILDKSLAQADQHGTPSELEARTSKKTPLLLQAVELKCHHYVSISSSSCGYVIEAQKSKMEIVLPCVQLCLLAIADDVYNMTCQNRDGDKLLPENLVLLDGLILIPDNDGSKLVLLNSGLGKSVSEMALPVRHRELRRLWYDERTRRLYGADKKGHISVFERSS